MHRDMVGRGYESYDTSHKRQFYTPSHRNNIRERSRVSSYPRPYFRQIRYPDAQLTCASSSCHDGAELEGVVTASSAPTIRHSEHDQNHVCQILVAAIDHIIEDRDVREGCRAPPRPRQEREDALLSQCNNFFSS